MESWKSFLFVAFLTSSAYFGNVECRRMRRLVLSTKKVFQRSAAVHLPSSYDDDDVSTTRIPVMESAIGYTHIPLLDAELKTTTETIRFKPMPANLSLSEDQEIKLNCSITLPGVHTDNHNIHWWKDGKALSTSQRIILNVANSGGTVIGTCSIPRIQRVDAGKYVCRLSLNGTSIESDPVNIQVEGLPFFLRNPEQLNVTQSTPFNLTCEAVGPPDPVAIYWFENSRKISDKADNSFSVLTWPGITETTRFSCEAHNVKGLSSSTTAVIHVKELPSSPSDVKVMNQTAHNVLVSWVPGFDGYSFFINCAIKVKMDSEDEEYAYTHNVSVPPHEYMIQQLQAMSQYHVSVACRNEIGWSNASQWILFNTTEGAPSAPPQNVTLSVIGTVLHVAWSEPPEEKLNGFLLGYKLVYKLESTTLDKSESIFLEKIEHEAYVNITTNATYIVQVAAVTGGGTGPLSDPKQVSVPEEPSNSRRNSTSVILGVVCGITGLILAVCLFMVTRKRILKMTKFRRIFGSNEELEPAVRYKAKKSYTRRAIEISLNNLGVSEDLQQKLQDVMIARNLLSLGKVLGEGEFGSVVEGNLKQPNGSNQKVAVKTMKLDSFSQREIEEFLSEAACMKDFNHPNVIKLLGVCLDANSRQTPRPMVILPFMKFGDLHSFLLRSRLGDNCQFLPVQTLLKFMIDIAQGMEYLSSRNFLHRDLAARNCMLRDDMTVCVADFGLSKKIYSGDYYRQGRIAKMPVKWISIESLADRIFTTKSDVWAFGVTMWEIETRGMTPYPGVQNHEIYDYLLEGHRLKQPDDCLDELYRIMYSCWSVDPLERPTFTELKISLEKLLEGLPYVRDKDDIIYINTSMPEEEDSATEYSRFHSPNDITGLCAKEHSRSTITVDVHETMDPEERYIVPIPSEDQGNISAQFDTPLLQSDIPHHIRPVPQELQPANGLESIHDFSEDSVIML